MRTHPRTIIAHHLLFSSYGFWLANDPRGSGSSSIRQPKFEPLGPLHPGRKTDQPTRTSLRLFYEQATPLLTHDLLWFNDQLRTAIAAAFEQTAKQRRYTCWSFAILSHHAHLCIRRHAHDYQTLWQNFANHTRTHLATQNILPSAHPLWAERPYSVYLYTPDDIRRTITYIQDNPTKEGLPPQTHNWLHPYTGWPSPNRPHQ